MVKGKLIVMSFNGVGVVWKIADEHGSLITTVISFVIFWESTEAVNKYADEPLSESNAPDICIFP